MCDSADKKCFLSFDTHKSTKFSDISVCASPSRVVFDGQTRRNCKIILQTKSHH